RRRRHTRCLSDWSSDVCSSDLGYSANAEVIISRRDSVLYIPERLITHRNDSSFVTVRAGPGKTEQRSIKTGLSDAINIEVLQGLQASDSIIEPPPREIS